MEIRYDSHVGDINICPSLHWLQLTCHSQVELSSLNGLKAWGEGQKLHHNIAFLLVQAEEEVTGDKNYGLSTIWVNPSQTRIPSMEEVVGKLTTWASSGSKWLYALVQLYNGTCHVPLHKQGHLGILPQRGMEAIPCGKISQLEVCQLLIASPQVIYPIVLNGCNEPIIITLPEPLASSISFTTGEPVYLQIDILPSLVEKLDQKAPPLGEVSTIMIASPHKSSCLNQKERAAWPWR